MPKNGPAHHRNQRLRCKCVPATLHIMEYSTHPQWQNGIGNRRHYGTASRLQTTPTLRTSDSGSRRGVGGDSRRGQRCESFGGGVETTAAAHSARIDRHTRERGTLNETFTLSLGDVRRDGIESGRATDTTRATQRHYRAASNNGRGQQTENSPPAVPTACSSCSEALYYIATSSARGRQALR